ncbi:MAG TPA: CcmD family protein [Longimicrobiaceae bacterium]|jgi:CcmD family protein
MRTARRFAFALLLALPALAPAGLRAQEPSSAPAAGAQAGGTAADPSASLQTRSVEPGSALPQRAAPPRTLREYTHVFVAFALAWILLFGYVVSLGRRWSAVERELAARA